MTTQHDRSIQWIALEGGSFWGGSNDYYPDEAPARILRVAPFDLASTPVTNSEFGAFIAASGYVTVAEREIPQELFPGLSAADRAPGSLVFSPTDGPVDLGDWQQWWRWVPGAHWRAPHGPGSSVDDLADHPVVQIAYEDALAYAEWVGGRLPTEDELEYAAGGGRRPAPYAWGEEREPGGRIKANTWRGRFPYRNDGSDGWVGTSPVGTFPPNDFGLYDLIGNVWEWTSTPYSSLRTSSSVASEAGCSCGCGPVGRDVQRMRVLKGGSHLCAPEYCLRYRPAARSPQVEDSAATHIGFRVARDATGALTATPSPAQLRVLTPRLTDADNNN